MTEEHTYPDPDPEEGFLYVREYEDRRLKQEFLFLSRLYHVVCSELAFRADRPNYRDGSGEITSTDIEAGEISDKIAEVLQNLKYSWPEDYYELEQ